MDIPLWDPFSVKVFHIINTNKINLIPDDDTIIIFICSGSYIRFGGNNHIQRNQNLIDLERCTGRIRIIIR